jgi:hypothetical protein
MSINAKNLTKTSRIDEKEISIKWPEESHKVTMKTR